MEMETLAVASDVRLETLKIESLPAEDGNDSSNNSSVPEDLGVSLGKLSDLVELAGMENVADLGNAVLHKDAKNTGAGLEFIDRETEAAKKVIEFGSSETDDVKFNVTVTKVTVKVPDNGGTETTTFDSVLESDGKITDNSQRVNLHGDETLAVSKLSVTGELESKDSSRENASMKGAFSLLRSKNRNREKGARSKDSNREKAASSKDSNREKVASVALTNRYAEKLFQFKAKLASNQTVLPSELLLKVSELASRCHVEGDAERLTAEYLDQPMVEFVEGSQRPEGDWHHEMETIFMSYFDQTDGEIFSSEPRKEKKQRREKKPRKEKEPRKEEKSGDEVAPERPKRVQPSHFIAIQITNPEIHEKLAAIQKSVVARKRILENVLVNLPTLHITLMVLYLKDNEQIERAKAALEVSKTRVLEHGKDLAALPFAGIGDFNGKIVFAKVQEGSELDRLKDIAEIVKQSFAEQELFSTDSIGFQAHLTIMKLSKCPWIFKRGVKKINPDFYVEQKDDCFGSQPIQSLQLCAMKKAENGYYPVDHEVFFDGEVSSSEPRKDEKSSEEEKSREEEKPREEETPRKEERSAGEEVKLRKEEKSRKEEKPRKEEKSREEEKPRKEEKAIKEQKSAGEEVACERLRRVKPSHFIAIQITNPEIHEKLADVQKSVVARERLLENVLVNLPTLHITLMVLYLKDNEQIERAKTALEVCKTRVFERGKDLAALPFVGIGDFNGKIVFAKVQEGPELDRLKDIAETVKQSFAEQKLFSTDSKGFQAHLTIMKLSNCPWIFQKGIKRINSDFYVEQKDDYFGSQPIQSLQLCAMKKAENGYYPVDHEVFFESETRDK